ncbi:Uncharacterised protein [Lysinibacillus sphaericus]|nr:Uncharacterised protein [Lysinibacillus sphaericus]
MNEKRQARKDARNAEFLTMTSEQKMEIVHKRLERIAPIPDEYELTFDLSTIRTQVEFNDAIARAITDYRKWIRNNIVILDELEADADDLDEDTGGDEDDAPDYKELYEELKSKVIADAVERSKMQLSDHLTYEMNDFSDAQRLYFANTLDVSALIDENGDIKPLAFKEIATRISEFKAISPPNIGTSQQYVDPSPGNGHRTSGRPPSRSNSDYGRSLFGKLKGGR